MASLITLPPELMFHVIKYLDMRSLQHFYTLFKEYRNTYPGAKYFIQAFLNNNIGMDPDNTIVMDDFYTDTLCYHSKRLACHSFFAHDVFDMLSMYPTQYICIRCYILAVSFMNKRSLMNKPLVTTDIPLSNFYSCSSILDVLDYLDYDKVSLRLISMCIDGHDLSILYNRSIYETGTYFTTPLHLAISHNRYDVVRVLLNHGHHTDVRDYDNRFPYQHCKSNDMLTLLINDGKISSTFNDYVTETMEGGYENFLLSNYNTGNRYRYWLQQKNIVHDSCTPLHTGNSDDEEDDLD